MLGIYPELLSSFGFAQDDHEPVEWSKDKRRKAFMSPRYHKSVKKAKLYNADMDCLIERLRKVRALNGDPSSFGMDCDAMKKFSFHRIELLTKLLSASAINK